MSHSQHTTMEFLSCMLKYKFELQFYNEKEHIFKKVCLPHDKPKNVHKEKWASKLDLGLHNCQELNELRGGGLFLN